MMNDYRQLVLNLQNRYNPDGQYLVERKLFSDLGECKNDIQRYVRLAMMAVDDSYTQKTKEAGKRVEQHLKGRLSNVSFRYQGSVMTDTHIKGYSDIDLLVICENFYIYDVNAVQNAINTYSWKYTPLQLYKLQSVDNNTRYQGNVYADLRNLRMECESVLRGTYQKCDTSHAKAIRITNQDLHRDVDIVVANWYDNVNSIINDDEKYRGIQVYDKEKNIKCTPDYPFLSIDRINSRSTETGGRLKRMIRFLKNVRADSKRPIDLSSFDINAICYAIDASQYKDLYYTELVFVVLRQLYKIMQDPGYRENLKSVDGNEAIFSKKQKVDEAAKLADEVSGIWKALS